MEMKHRVEVQLDERTRELLSDSLLDGQGIDAKIRKLVEAEYLRQIAQYRRFDQALAQKYGMDFDSFVEHRVTQKWEYSWEVEQDAMGWETAVGGIATLERKLRKPKDITGG